MSDVPKSSGVECPECGAQISDQDNCWLCQVRLERHGIRPDKKIKPKGRSEAKPPPIQYVEPPPVSHPAFVDRQKKVNEENLFIVSIAAVVLVLFVGIGLFFTDLTIGIGFTVVAIPAIVAIAGVMAQRRLPQDASVAERVAYGGARVAMGVTITLAVIALVVIGSVVALFFVCLIALSGGFDGIR